MSDFNIEVKGIEKLTANLGKFGKEIISNLGAAGAEAAQDVILPTRGLQRYPPSTAANQPPPPYYVRGRGTQTQKGNRGNSERYGTQFVVQKRGLETIIGNRAGYAPYLGGEKQSTVAALHGWRILKDVAEEKIGQIKARYQAWINKTIKDLGL
jgi:hypothetical protein